MAAGQKESDTLRILRELAASKAEKEVVNFEFSRLKEQLTELKGQVSDASHHQCLQTDLFTSVGERLNQLKGDIDVNANEIRRLYTWQAGVGISLLVFFLTVGVAVFRFVDGLDFAVKDHSDAIQKLEKQVDAQSRVRALDEEHLRKVLSDFFNTKNAADQPPK